MTRTLMLRELNRATLARQMLLTRKTAPVMEAVERLIGLQSQIPNPPYIGLWTRLQDFQRVDLTQLMEQRQIVRAAMMRSTLHLVSAADHQRFRSALQPALVKALSAFFGARAKVLDIAQLVEAAREYLAVAPRSTGELKKRLLEIAPDCDADAMAYAVRAYLPLIQVPPGGTWGTGSMAAYVTADTWLGENTMSESLQQLFFRYLAAFGPASIMDFQTWSGLVNLKSVLEPFKAELIVYRDEQGKELLDLPDMLLPDADTIAPIRFIPEYDNLLIAQADRRRIIADEDRPKVFLSSARVRATFLVDGFVRGTWKTERVKKAATLIIEPFAVLPNEVREALVDEGERLITFIEVEADAYRVQFADTNQG
ncbi:MAG: AlkZ family DNA glycosylase [Anaerolineae bacterium]|nr:AlkZ family DNA glycosylase [Anaerolineae bacterium]